MRIYEFDAVVIGTGCAGYNCADWLYDLGYKNIAVSIAADDNILHKDFVKLEEEYGVNIYRFGLCSTGISEETAKGKK